MIEIFRQIELQMIFFNYSFKMVISLDEKVLETDSGDGHTVM